MNVLHVVPAYYPATYWGGPIFSTYYLCNALACSPDMRLAVLTTDTAGPARHQRIAVTSFPMKYPGDYLVYFCRRWLGAEFSPGMLIRLWRMARKANLVHLTAVYSLPTIPTLLVARLLRKPVVWSPRGALQHWDGTTRPRVKRAWDKVCNMLLDPTRAVLHVTSQQEADESIARIPNARCEVIPNGVDVPKLPGKRTWIPSGMVRLLFIGRLHPKKGIENLLQAIKLLPADSANLAICGTGERTYEAGLMELTTSLGIADRVDFLGHVDGEAKVSAFMNADICIVPSFTENFGMVIADSLAHGVPVIASHGTPWPSLESEDCGLWVDNTADTLAEAVTSMRIRNLDAMGKRGREWMLRDFGWDTVAHRMHSLYARLLAIPA